MSARRVVALLIVSAALTAGFAAVPAGATKLKKEAFLSGAGTGLATLPNGAVAPGAELGLVISSENFLHNEHCSIEARGLTLEDDGPVSAQLQGTWPFHDFCPSGVLLQGRFSSVEIRPPAGFMPLEEAGITIKLASPRGLLLVPGPCAYTFTKLTGSMGDLSHSDGGFAGRILGKLDGKDSVRECAPTFTLGVTGAIGRPQTLSVEGPDEPFRPTEFVWYPARTA